MTDNDSTVTQHDTDGVAAWARNDGNDADSQDDLLAKCVLQTTTATAVSVVGDFAASETSSNAAGEVDVDLSLDDERKAARRLLKGTKSGLNRPFAMW